MRLAFSFRQNFINFEYRVRKINGVSQYLSNFLQKVVEKAADASILLPKS